MRRPLILVGIAFLTVFLPLSLLSAPGRKVGPSEAEVSQHRIVSTSSVAVTVQVQSAAQLPNQFSLGQNYPNPYNSSTIILYSCSQEAFVSLKVYNILGQEVATLVEERKAAGFYSVLWDSRDRQGHSLASGIYLYRLIAGQFVDTKKLVLLR